jgi:UDP-4-amino-4,6-dideoxy-N-acetyl-beta-L-altrosamine N-acetyltransferase
MGKSSKHMATTESLLIKLKNNYDFEKVKFVNVINLTEEEKLMVLNWRNSDEVRRWMFTDHLISREEHFIFINSLKENDNCYYAVIKENDQYCGTVSLQKIDFINRSCNLGIYSVQKGKGRMMLYNLLNLWFRVLGMNILDCELLENNKRAHALYESFGFKTAAATSRHVLKRDKKINVISMSLSKDNWTDIN